jgi:hypothetical protein
VHNGLGVMQRRTWSEIMLYPVTAFILLIIGWVTAR